MRLHGTEIKQYCSLPVCHGMILHGKEMKQCQGSLSVGHWMRHESHDW
jgi:hypothetical protein